MKTAMKKKWIVQIKMLSGQIESTKTPFEADEYEAQLYRVQAIAYLWGRGIFPSNVEVLEYVPEGPSAAASRPVKETAGARLV